MGESLAPTENSSAQQQQQGSESCEQHISRIVAQHLAAGAAHHHDHEDGTTITGGGASARSLTARSMRIYQVISSDETFSQFVLHRGHDRQCSNDDIVDRVESKRQMKVNQYISHYLLQIEPRDG